MGFNSGFKGLKDEHRLSVLEKRVQGLGGRKQQETGANYIMSTCMICISHQILFAWLNQEEWDEQDISIYGGDEKYIQGLGDKT